jgi:hypothetical protein
VTFTENLPPSYALLADDHDTTLRASLSLSLHHFSATPDKPAIQPVLSPLRETLPV